MISILGSETIQKGFQSSSTHSNVSKPIQGQAEYDCLSTTLFSDLVRRIFVYSNSPLRAITPKNAFAGFLIDLCCRRRKPLVCKERNKVSQAGCGPHSASLWEG